MRGWRNYPPPSNWLLKWILQIFVFTGSQICIWRARFQILRSLAFNSIPEKFLKIMECWLKSSKLLKMVLCRAAIDRQIECSGFFLVNHNGQTQIYRLVSGQSDACLWRNRDFPTEDQDLKKCALELCWTATIKPRQIERSGFCLLDHNGQTWIYRLVSGQSDVRLWRNCDFPIEDDVCPPPLPALTRVKIAKT